MPRPNDFWECEGLYKLGPLAKCSVLPFSNHSRGTQGTQKTRTARTYRTRTDLQNRTDAQNRTDRQNGTDLQSSRFSKPTGVPPVSLSLCTRAMCQRRSLKFACGDILVGILDRCPQAKARAKDDPVAPGCDPTKLLISKLDLKSSWKCKGCCEKWKKSKHRKLKKSWDWRVQDLDPDTMEMAEEVMWEIGEALEKGLEIILKRRRTDPSVSLSEVSQSLLQDLVRKMEDMLQVAEETMLEYVADASNIPEYGSGSSSGFSRQSSPDPEQP